MEQHGVLLYYRSIALSATRRYLSYSEADFEFFFAPQWRQLHRLGEIWHRSPPSCQISSHRCNEKAIGPSKLKEILTMTVTESFTEIWSKCGLRTPCRSMSLARFSRILQNLWQVLACVRKFEWICSRGYCVRRGLSWGGRFSPNFEHP